jgi:ethanolamine kinase
LVFGHNDLLSGNILIMQQPGFDPANPDRDGRIVFIDYEYGAYTYRDFDIGNHFTEYAGFEGDYDRCGARGCAWLCGDWTPSRLSRELLCCCRYPS